MLIGGSGIVVDKSLSGCPLKNPLFCNDPIGAVRLKNETNTKLCSMTRDQPCHICQATSDKIPLAALRELEQIWKHKKWSFLESVRVHK
jgi:hypothetical protein